MWSRLYHPNILPFVGYALESEDCPLLISEWMENGTVNKYVKGHPDCDIHQIVSLLPSYDQTQIRDTVLRR